MIDPRVDGDLAPWLRRLAQYLYLVDLVADRRVLEVGCGTGYGTHFLADHGAARAVGVDRDAAAVTAARARWRLSNLDFRREDPGAIELDDDTFDVVFVPAGAELLRRADVLRELRRVLDRDGYLVFSAPNADRPHARGGVSYYDLVDHLGAHFQPVRMIAQAPLVAMSLVEYAAGEASDADIELDTSLAALEEEVDVSHYVALCGGDDDALRGFSIVQLPAASGLNALATEASAAAGAEIERLRERIRDLEGEAARPREAPAADAAAALAPDADASEREIARLRALLDEAELEVGRVAGETAIEVNKARAEVKAMRERVLALEADRARRESETRDAAVPAPAGPSVTEQIADALAAHADEAARLQTLVAERTGYIEELHDDIADLRERLARATSRGARLAETVAGLRGELADWRTRASMAEGELLRATRELESGAVASPAASPGDGEPAELERLRAELAETKEKLERATRNWREAEAKSDDVWRRVGELSEELDAEREKAVARSADQRRKSQKELARSIEDSQGKLLNLKNQLLKADNERDELEAKVATLEAKIAELEHAVEDAETARAELEQRLGESEARREELEGGAFSPEPTAARPRPDLPRPAPVAAPESAGNHGASSQRVGELRAGLAAVVAEISTQRRVVAEVEAGLARLAEANREGYEEGAAETRLTEIATELGIKDAELTLLDIGVKSLQQRLIDAVAEVVRTRDAVAAAAGPDEVRALIEELTENLSSRVPGAK